MSESRLPKGGWGYGPTGLSPLGIRHEHNPCSWCGGAQGFPDTHVDDCRTLAIERTWALMVEALEWSDTALSELHTVGKYEWPRTREKIRAALDAARAVEKEER